MAGKSIKKNYILNLMYQILTILTPIITAPYLSRVLGADGIGIVSLAENYVSYFTLFAAMGVAIYGQREVSYVQDDIKRRSIIFWNSTLMKAVFSVVCLGAYLVYAYFARNTLLALILSLNIVATLVDITWYFQGIEEFGRIVGRNTFFKVLNIIYIFVFIKDSGDILLYAAGLAGFLLLSNLSLWVMLPKFLTRVSIKEIRPFKGITVMLALFVPTIAIQVYTALDKTMIGIITGSDYENGYYEQAMKISKMVLTIVTALGTVMVPRIGHHFSNGEMDKVKELMLRSYRFVWFLGLPLTIGLFLCAPNMVPWFFGSDFIPAIPLLQILAVLVVIIGLSNVTGIQYLVPTKREKYLTISVVVGATVNLLLNIVLIIKFQAIGAAIASVIAELAVTITQLIFVRKEISVFAILSQGVKYFIAVVIMAVILEPMMIFLSPSVLNTMLMVLAGVFAYIGTLLIARDKFLIDNIKIITAKVLKK